MTTTNSQFLNVNQLDFNSIKTNLKNFLSSQGRFADYDFEGSNFSVLLDILAYNTYYNAVYLNQIGSEMFLDSASLLESAVSHAKELNYIPRSRTSAVAYIDITIETGNATPSSITIPQFYQFTTTINDTTITFSTQDEILVKPVGGIYTASNVAIYEGSIVEEYFNISSNNLLTLESGNVDTNSITVSVYPSNTSNVYSNWTKASSLYGLTPESNVYFLQGAQDTKYQISFGNDVTGRAVRSGAVVKILYRDTIGSEGNKAYSFAHSTPIEVYSDISVTTVSEAIEGSEREEIESIKFNAPRHFSTQERAVTAEDYINIVKASFPQIQSVNAFGGEDLDPPQYGKIAISVKPYGTYGFISDGLEQKIISLLSTKNITIEPIIIDPEYFYVAVESYVTYDKTLTTSSSSQIKALVENAIVEFANTSLMEFGDDLRYSRLVNAIDDSETSIVSNQTDLKLIYKWTPPTGSAQSISFTFDNVLLSQSTLYALPVNYQQTVYSSLFTYTHTDGTNYSCFFGDDGTGNIHIYTNQTINGVITRTALANNVGTVEYETGAIVIATTIYSYSGTSISIYGIPENHDLQSTKNKFLIVDPVDVVVEMLEVND